MNYELAKELNDAGFPQEVRDGHMTNNLSFEDFELNPDMTHKKKDGTPEFREAYVPTLNELIEACGEEFSSLNNLYHGKWRARGTKRANMIWKEGGSLEEVVAKLWLELNSQTPPKDEV